LKEWRLSECRWVEEMGDWRRSFKGCVSLFFFSFFLVWGLFAVKGCIARNERWDMLRVWCWCGCWCLCLKESVCGVWDVWMLMLSLAVGGWWLLVAGCCCMMLMLTPRTPVPPSEARPHPIPCDIVQQKQNKTKSTRHAELGPPREEGTAWEGHGGNSSTGHEERVGPARGGVQET
jgi:hypothetical protein